MDGEPTEQGTFKTRLMDILCREYGRCNIDRYDDGWMKIDTDDGDVSIWMDEGYAVLISTLKDAEGNILAIPKDDIAEYIPDLARIYISPAIYPTSNGESYVPHYNFMLHESDIGNPWAVIMAVDKLAFMAGVASRTWNDATSGHGPENGEGSGEE